MNEFKEFNTEEHYEYWGALQLSLWLIDFLSGKYYDAKSLRTPGTVINILKFLCRSKSDMLTFLYNKEGIGLKLAPVKDKKGKIKAYMPTKITWFKDSNRVIHENEIISPQEFRYRDTAKILGAALDRAADMISLLTSRNKNDILNSLLAENKENLEIPETLSEPVPEQKYTGKTILVMTETEYAEFEKIEKAKKEAENKSKGLDVGFRVYKLDDVKEGEPLPELPPRPEPELQTFEEFKEMVKSGIEAAKSELGKEAPEEPPELELAMEYSLNCEIAHRVAKITDEQFYQLLIKYCGKETCHRLLYEPEKETK